MTVSLELDREVYLSGEIIQARVRVSKQTPELPPVDRNCSPEYTARVVYQHMACFAFESSLAPLTAATLLAALALLPGPVSKPPGASGVPH